MRSAARASANPNTRKQPSHRIPHSSEVRYIKSSVCRFRNRGMYHAIAVLYPPPVSPMPQSRIPTPGDPVPVTHTLKGKAKLLNRVRRIKGQVEAIERALEA